MNYVDGDLLDMGAESLFDCIVHGCNCWDNMGAGIARAIALRWPAARLADRKAYTSGQAFLGNYSVCSVEGGKLKIINAYTQYHPGRPTEPDDSYEMRLEAIHKFFTGLNKVQGPYKFGIPRIGAGLAGGHWSDIEPIIDAATPSIDLTCVNYVQK